MTEKQKQKAESRKLKAKTQIASGQEAGDHADDLVLLSASEFRVDPNSWKKQKAESKKQKSRQGIGKCRYDGKTKAESRKFI